MGKVIDFLEYLSRRKKDKAEVHPPSQEMGQVIDFEAYRLRRLMRETFQKAKESDPFLTNTEQRINEDNERVLKKMEQGDNLSTSTLQDSWFPARGKFDREKGRMVPTRPDDEEEKRNPR